MPFCKIFLIFSILLTICCFQIISSVNESTTLEDDEAKTLDLTTLPIYDVNSENLLMAQILADLYQEEVPLLSPASSASWYLNKSTWDQSSEAMDDNDTEYQNYNFFNPSYLRREKDNFESEEVNQLEKFKQTVTADTDAIVEQFNQFVPLSFEPAFVEHRQRANAFSTCCRLNLNAALLKKYVDAYGSLAEQMNIINECVSTITLAESTRSYCKIELDRLEDIRRSIHKFTSLYSNSNTTKDEDRMQWLDNAIKPSIDVKNIVYEYDSATFEFCDLAIVLLWEPANLIRCETKYRLSLLDDFTTFDEYDRFNKEISVPFQQKALNLMLSVKNAWNKVVDQAQKDFQAIVTNTPVPDDQVNDDVNKIINTLSVYETQLQHPMIAHHAKRAHVYKICCRPVHTRDMLNQYMNNFIYDPTQDHYMDKLLTKCVREQLPILKDDITVDSDCTVAYNDFTDAMGKRQNFINKYGKQNPDMIQHFGLAVWVRQAQTYIIQAMAEYVDQHCHDQHIFELMFNTEKNIDCEILIRSAISTQNSKNYSYYDIFISQPFQNMNRVDWDRLTQVLINLKMEDDTISTVMPHFPSTKPHILHDSRQKQRLLIGLNNGASSTTMVISQCFSIIFMFLIQIIFF